MWPAGWREQPKGGQGGSTTSLLTGVTYAATVASGCYVYEIGGSPDGSASTATVEYASFTGNGAIGSWATTTSLPTAEQGERAAIYNGYLYSIGGYTGSAFSANVYYAPINPSNGSVGAWTATTILPRATGWGAVTVANGYLYFTGGNTSAGYNTTTWIAGFNSDGSLGSWNSSGWNLLCGSVLETLAYNNGYLYEMGGLCGGSGTNTVYYSQILANGLNGQWIATTSLPMAGLSGATSFVANNYVYNIGGAINGGGITAGVESAPINSNGTLGSWTATTSLPAATEDASSVTYEGYVYEIGGDTAASAGAGITTDIYAPIAANGGLGTW